MAAARFVAEDSAHASSSPTGSPTALLRGGGHRHASFTEGSSSISPVAQRRFRMLAGGSASTAGKGDGGGLARAHAWGQASPTLNDASLTSLVDEPDTASRMGLSQLMRTAMGHAAPPRAPLGWGRRTTEPRLPRLPACHRPPSLLPELVATSDDLEQMFDVSTNALSPRPLPFHQRPPSRGLRAARMDLGAPCTHIPVSRLGAVTPPASRGSIDSLLPHPDLARSVPRSRSVGPLPCSDRDTPPVPQRSATFDTIGTLTDSAGSLPLEKWDPCHAPARLRLERQGEGAANVANVSGTWDSLMTRTRSLLAVADDGSPDPPSDDDAGSPTDEKAVEDRARMKLNFWAPLCSEVLPFLSVSGHAPAENLEVLILAGVTHVVNTVRMIVGSPFTDHLAYIDYSMMDTPNEDISLAFPHVISVVEKVREKDGRALIHCQQGSSRSCTLILAYMMWADGVGFKEALEALRQRRGVAKPNMGFSARLLMWEKQLRGRGAFDVAVYRLSAFTEHSAENVVLGLDRHLCTPGGAASLQRPRRCFDPRTMYLILDDRPEADPAPLVWVGSRAAPRFLSRMTGDLLRDVLLYGHRRGSRAFAHPTVVHEDADDCRVRAVWAHLGIEGAAEEDGMDYALMNERGEGEGWAWDPAAEAERRQTRARDLLALKAGKGGIGKATPRLQAEMLEVVEMFVRTGEGAYRAHPTYAASAFDDDEFDEFRNEYYDATCVFVKHKADLRLVDVWAGEEAPELPLAHLLKEFQAWAQTPAAPPWTAKMAWGGVSPTLTRDGGDGDSEIRFYSRWVRH
eukprot:TRINITY_DN8976_c0_g1_i1.p1 TRINITY_DN8976_c0_g1~~TRINITY_DN8976_c0_g1_i1.p1  ORF type:complete len:926 (+),score=284.21 TRINITY_DN8976_c0_g1_i1:385-2778(+)